MKASALQIKLLQANLASAGFNPGPFDGIWGSHTAGAMCASVADPRVTKDKLALLGGVIFATLRDNDMIDLRSSIAQASDPRFR